MRRRLVALALLPLTAGALAQTLADQQRALTAARRAAVAAVTRAADLDRAAIRATSEAARVRRREAAVAGRIGVAEIDIAAARARLQRVEVLRRRQRAKLSRLQAPVVRLAAALQTLARRPPVLALVQPGSINDVVHVRALLAAGVPVMRARTAGMRAELHAAERLRGEAAAAARALVAGRERLESARLALAQLEAKHRTRSLELVDSAMTEQDRATALDEQARDIVDRMDAFDADDVRRTRLAALPGPIPRPAVSGVASARTVAVRLLYRLPVSGRVVRGFGEVSEAGVRARGVTLATAPGAHVIAPMSGRVGYAGTFRRYRRIAIIDHGDGWTTLLTGLDSTVVSAGDIVARGTLLGSAPADSLVTVELRHAGRPVDVVALVTSR